MRLVIAAVLLIGVASSACTNESDPETGNLPTTTADSVDAPSAGPGPLIVSLPEATYGCGPADGTEVQFTVTSNQPFQAIASLAVGGRTVATGAPFEVPVGTVAETLPVTLDSEAYAVAEGELSVYSSPDGDSLARRTVVLRIAGGGCG